MVRAIPILVYLDIEHADEKIRSPSTWGLLPLGLFSLRWNIETNYYETKTFWSLCDYMVRSINGDRISGAYAQMRLSIKTCKVLFLYLTALLFGTYYITESQNGIKFSFSS